MPKKKQQKAENQRIISEIISGVVIFNFQNKTYIINEASLIEKNISDKLYELKIKDAIRSGLMTESEIINYMIDNNFWSDLEEEEYDLIPKKLERAKLQLYNAHVKYRDKAPFRKNIKNIKKKLLSLIQKRNIYLAQSVESYAALCRNKYVICSNVTDSKGNKVINSENYLDTDGSLINLITNTYQSSQYDDNTIRRLSHEDPWRTFWNCGKSTGGVFDKKSSELTSQQINIITWSRVYDNIYESHECPSDEVVKDDDLLDGWLVYQHEKNKKRKNESDSEAKKTGVKGDEVYIMADTQEDASRVYNLNDAGGRAQVRSIDKQLEKSNKPIPVEKTVEAKLEMRQMQQEQLKSRL
tara:strand:+ start:2091 stop:3155 length:1065 start_codon:yes stop_codon:yes gene_type:complete